MEYLKIDCNNVLRILKLFLVEEANKSGFSKVILGLSGGIDSALVAYLCANSFSPENVTALIMPYKSSNPENMDDAKLVAETLKINYEVIDISQIVDSCLRAIEDNQIAHR